MASEQQIGTASSPAPTREKVLATTCAAHAVHDGFTDTLYLLLPIWQAEFALSYGAVGVLRALYSAVLAGLQVPAASLAPRFGAVTLLAGGTAISGIGYMLAGASAGLPLLVFSLMLGGLGSSTQHPIGSDLVASAYRGSAARPALGTYNFAGDLGKMAFPALASLLLIFVSWRATAFCIGAIGIAAAIGVFLALPRGVMQTTSHEEAAEPGEAPPHGGSMGLRLLLSIGMADSAARMGFMTFLPFVLAAKGASLTQTGLALTLTFAGGAFGKLACGFLGARLGVIKTILLTETATAALIIAVLALPTIGILAILPLLGTMLNGTSSVVYGSVPDVAAPQEQARAFGIFYTATIGAGAVAPIGFGLVSDGIGLFPMMVVIAATALLTLPPAIMLGIGRHAGVFAASGRETRTSPAR
jgi:MFS family permease